MSIPIPIAVIDVETTGFSNTDRVVEISIATLDRKSLDVVEEYDTLVNPLRDVPDAASDIHGLTASQLEAAPTFEEIAPALAKRLDGAVLVAHNASFDMRMLGNEFERLGIAFDPGKPFCTCSGNGRMSLKDACGEYGVAMERHHRALSDVRATAGIFGLMVQARGRGLLKPCVVAACAAGEQGDVVVRTLRREAFGGPAVDRVRRSPWKEPRLHYRYEVNAALDDNHITEREWGHLDDLADALGLTEPERLSQHMTIYRRAEEASKRDGRISGRESRHLQALAEALGLDVAVPGQTQQLLECRWDSGTGVCFTGSGGAMLSRREMCAIAKRIGHVVFSSVSRKVDVLVAAEISSFSGKAKTARDRGIQVADAGTYLTHAYSIIDHDLRLLNR